MKPIQIQAKINTTVDTKPDINPLPRNKLANILNPIEIQSKMSSDINTNKKAIIFLGFLDKVDQEIICETFCNLELSNTLRAIKSSMSPDTLRPLPKWDELFGQY